MFRPRNMSPAEAGARDSASNGLGTVLTDNEPGTATCSIHDIPQDTSRLSTVQPKFLEEHFNIQRWQEGFNQLWARGVSIAVDLCVPLLVIFMILVHFSLRQIVC
jgi:hypothetical protein